MIILERFCDQNKLGCFGELYIGGEFICYTVEQPWRDNKPFKSCVPVGHYTLVPFESEKYGSVVALENPELNVYANQSDASEGDRYACLIHAANWSHQLQGCIAPGAALAWGIDVRTNTENLMVTRSRATLKNLLAKGETDILIRWKHG